MVALGMVRGDNEHVELEQATVLALVVSSVDPGIRANGHARRELHLLNLLDHLGVVEAHGFQADHFVHVHGPLDMLGQLLDVEHLAVRQVDQGFDEGMAIQAMKVGVHQPWWRRGERLAGALGFNVRDYILLGRFLDVDGLETKLNAPEGFLQKVDGERNLVRADGVKWVGKGRRHSLGDVWEGYCLWC